MIVSRATNRVIRCLNCNDYLDAVSEDYCSRACELEHMYEREATCKACNGSGGQDTADGQWRECRKCYGSGYCIKIKG